MLGQDIIRDFTEGNTEAFERIYGVFYKEIFAYCYRYSLSRENAEELTHDIFLQLWKTRDYIEPEQGIKGYLLTVSKNIVFTWLRNASRKKRMRTEIETYFILQQEEHLPEKRLEASMSLSSFRKTLNDLPPKRKLVYEMIRFKEMTYNEVAEQLSISRDAVKDHMVKANRVIQSMKSNKNYMDYITILYFLLFPTLL
ncbi:RNA polymerase sigma factor [Arcticibacter tournemirensis]|uniref:Sigma-70 family RNA polymerase sigma factor n=1 Tax=Arcticibacter tournemirensis TaxID=699437 RepID=A0A4Q0MA21_9SPHI|nr:sigma-70 family RNA polymerase sigma factor [Arcticibacter tournemirensis]RXF70067.1 sigma-70 family RNA polymerase sigma factor [Arcticibacter tournemirensis]